MHKLDLLIRLAELTDLSPAKADLVLAAMIENITNSLSRDQAVALAGFGSFVVSKRAARKGRHPQTGLPLDIAASRSVVFKPAKALKEAVKMTDMGVR